jgi:hypothetical protein
LIDSRFSRFGNQFHRSKQSIAVGFALFKESVYLGSTRKYMYSCEKVSAQEATSLIEKLVSEVTGMNKHTAVAVTGPEGELVTFLTMDEGSAAASLSVQNKAYTAAAPEKHQIDV